MNNLDAITDAIYAALTAKNQAREATLTRSRELVRHCSEAIRAIHRHDWDAAQAKLAVVRQAADELRAGTHDHADLYYAGYAHDAMKEVVEAFCTFALVRGEALPTPSDLGIEEPAYLNGLAEAATELRRFILDILRREDGDRAEAERLLAVMDSIYDKLVTFDFPDAITNGLRRQTDIVRGVLERTRGDLTTTIQQQRLQSALDALQKTLDS